MLDLIQTTEEGHYEQYRQAQMETRKFGCVPLPPLLRRRSGAGSSSGTASSRRCARAESLDMSVVVLTVASFLARSEPKVKKVENPKFKEEEEAVRQALLAHREAQGRSRAASLYMASI